MKHIITHRRIRLRRAGAILLLIILIASLASPAYALGKAEKKTTSRAIAIVFDNSGSMYSSGNKAWCQALYAIEVFAAMLNEGDILQVHPMHKITVGGSEYSMDDPLVIHNLGEVEKIRNIYTPDAQGTPIETIDAAYNGLTKCKADEKWLIVLTDGNQFHKDDVLIEDTRTALNEVLTKCNDTVNTLYLGIGTSAASAPDSVSTKGNVYKKLTADSAQVPAVLSSMCNLIFGRDELSGSNIQGNTINFDIPMSKLILFVQGENVANVSLKAADGSAVTGVVSTYSPHYSETKAGNYPNSVVDTSLQGTMVTFENCMEGTYTLDYSGSARSISAYYEPDVDFSVNLVDENGQVVSTGSEFYPGEYSLQYSLADNDGKPINSPLLGSTEYEITYILNDEEKTKTDTQAGSIPLTLSIGDTMDVNASVIYLSGYKISKKGYELGWPEFGITIEPHPVGELKIDIGGGQESYTLTQLQSGGEYPVTVTYSGRPLTAEELKRVDWEPQIQGGNLAAAVEISSSGAKLVVTPQGSITDVVCGDYTVSLFAALEVEDAQVAISNNAQLGFTVEDMTEQLGLEILQHQKFIVLKKADQAQDTIVRLLINGQPLSESQYDATTFSATCDELPLIVEADRENSAYHIRLDNSRTLPTGNHTILLHAAGEDYIGRTITADSEVSTQIQKYPPWMPYLLVLLIILLILLLVWLYLNQKILPKSITVASATFTVDGSQIPGSPICTYTGKNKKHGTLEIRTPRYTPNPTVKGGVTLELEAISPRRTKSSSRSAKVVKVTPINRNAITSIKIGTATFQKDPNTGNLVRSGSKAAAKAEFQIASGSRCNIMGEAMDGDGGSTAFTLVFQTKHI